MSAQISILLGNKGIVCLRLHEFKRSEERCVTKRVFYHGKTPACKYSSWANIRQLTPTVPPHVLVMNDFTGLEPH